MRPFPTEKNLVQSSCTRIPADPILILGSGALLQHMGAGSRILLAVHVASAGCSAPTHASIGMGSVGSMGAARLRKIFFPSHHDCASHWCVAGACCCCPRLRFAAPGAIAPGNLRSPQQHHMHHITILSRIRYYIQNNRRLTDLFSQQRCLD